MVAFARTEYWIGARRRTGSSACFYHRCHSAAGMRTASIVGSRVALGPQFGLMVGSMSLVDGAPKPGQANHLNAL
jgi:hypothetical protein